MTDKLTANKVARVLSGTLLKYTCVIYLKTGQVFEFQSDTIPIAKYNVEIGGPVLIYGNYDEKPICKWDDVAAVFHEVNPGKEKE